MVPYARTSTWLVGGITNALPVGPGALFTAAMPEAPRLASMDVPTAAMTSILPEPPFDAPMPFWYPFGRLVSPVGIEPGA